MQTIILEGPDGSGKSTLASFLVSHHDYEPVHFGVPKPEEKPYDVYMEALIASQSPEKATVFDRLHLGELIYGTVMRKKSRITMKELDLVERYIESIDGQVVICLPPYRRALHNWLARKGKEYIEKQNDFRRVYDMYVDMLMERNRNYIWFDYTRWNALSVANSLVAMYGKRNHYRVMGSQRPRFLFVVNRNSGPWDLPAMQDDRLNQALTLSGFEESELAFTAAYGQAGDRQTRFGERFSAFENKPLIVAVGDEAHRCLSEEAIFHVVIQDPEKLKKKQLEAYVHKLAALRRNTK